MEITEIIDKREKEKSKKRVVRIEFIGSNLDSIDCIIDEFLTNLKIILEQRDYPREINNIEVDIY
jgi:hypothetical protein